jgi:hypothetical protein
LHLKSPRPNFYPVMAQAVSRRILTAGVRARSRVTFCGICGGQKGSVRFFPGDSVMRHSLSVTLFRVARSISACVCQYRRNLANNYGGWGNKIIDDVY